MAVPMLFAPQLNPLLAVDCLSLTELSESRTSCIATRPLVVLLGATDAQIERGLRFRGVAATNCGPLVVRMGGIRPPVYATVPTCTRFPAGLRFRLFNGRGCLFFLGGLIVRVNKRQSSNLNQTLNLVSIGGLLGTTNRKMTKKIGLSRFGAEKPLRGTKGDNAGKNRPAAYLESLILE
jgi:hypothetical protein